MRTAAVLVATGLLGAGCGTSPDVVQVPAGASFVVALTAPLSTGDRKAGDAVEATVEVPLFVGAASVIDAGSVVRGRLTSVVSGADGAATPSLTIVFQEVVDPEGGIHRIQARPIAVAGERMGADVGLVEEATPEEEASGELASGEAAPEEMPEPETAEAEPTTGGILEAGPGPIMLPAPDAEIELASGQAVRVELAERTEFPL